MEPVPFPIAVGPFWIGLAFVWIVLFLSVMHGPNGGAAALRLVTCLVMGVCFLTCLTYLARLSGAAAWFAVLVLPILAFMFYLIGVVWCRGQMQTFALRIGPALEPILGPFIAQQVQDWVVKRLT